MANYTQYIPQTNSTTYPTSISNCFTALTSDVTDIENDKLNLSGGSMTGALIISVGNLTLSSGNIVVSGTVDGRDILADGTKLDLIEALADVTDTTNVTAAGALMDSEVDLDIKTLVLPASTTISTFGASLVDDADAAAVLTTLGLDTDLATISVPASTTISTFGASLIDDADAAAARTTLGAAAAFRGCLVYLDANQSLADAIGDTINFDQEDYDTDTIHDNVTNNDRLVVPSGVTKVIVKAKVVFSGNATGIRNSWISKNGTASYIGEPSYLFTAPDASSSAEIILTSPVLSVSDSDYFILNIYQNSGGSLNMLGDVTGRYAWFSMEIIE